MSELPPKPLPIPDRDSLPFWEGVRAGELRVQRCRGCGAYRWPARAICNRCHSFDADWVVLSGRGVVRSWVTTHQPFAPAFKDDLPYHTVLVELAEQDDLQMIGRLTDPSVEPRAGMEVRASFEPVAEHTTLVYWRPA
jgi:uncharacterized OB-fold protein